MKGFEIPTLNSYLYNLSNSTYWAVLSPTEASVQSGFFFKYPPGTVVASWGPLKLTQNHGT